MAKFVGKKLAARYQLKVREARYREDGVWYHPIYKFPAAYFDANGVLLFATEDEYLNNVRVGPDPGHVHVEFGISSRPGYRILSPLPSTII